MKANSAQPLALSDERRFYVAKRNGFVSNPAAHFVMKVFSWNIYPGLVFTYKNITISDIADMLKVAPSTVSRALNGHHSISDKRRDEVLALAKSFGYRPNDIARNLRIKKTMTIGVIVPQLDNRFIASALAGIEHVTNRNGYSLLISESSGTVEKESASAKAMFKNRPDGVLLAISRETKELTHFDSFFRSNTPVTFFHESPVNADTNTIAIDNRKAGYDAAIHLAAQGCKNIMAIIPEIPSGIYQERLLGFEEALKMLGYPNNKNSVKIDRLDHSSGQEIANAILKLKKLPDGIFIPNDNCAVGCMLELKKHSIDIPGQVAFVGFNDELVSTVVQPALTTIKYPAYEMGELAAQNLVDRLNGSSVSVGMRTLIPAELIVRESSGKNGLSN